MALKEGAPEHIIPAAKIHFPEEDIASMQAEFADMLRTGQLILGPKTDLFERKFSEYLGANHALAVGSGTAALEIAMRSIGIEGKDVIVPGNTFYATAGAALHAGGNLKFADIENETFGVDADQVSRLIDQNTAAVVVVHIGGTPARDLLKLREICDQSGIALIEDSAHAHGSSIDGQMVGTIGDIGTFSFFPTKVMTSGEGGMLVTNNPKFIQEGKIYRDQGKASGAQNFHTHQGYAWRMSEIHALLGLSQLARLDDFIENRRKVAAIYDQGISGISGLFQANVPTSFKSNYYKYIVKLADFVNRDFLKAEMKKRGVSLSGEVYTDGLHRQPVFAGKYHTLEGGLPNTDHFCGHHICLPVSAVTTEEEAKYVINSLNEICRYSGTR